MLRQGKFQAGPSPYLLFFAGFLGLCLFFGALAFRYLSWSWPALWCLASSAAVFVLAGYDKAAAGGASLRVPEAVLFSGALIGGAPGLLLAMKIFRHKTRKASFQFVVATIIVLQVAVWHFYLRNL